jgi:hypothetical protein
VDWSGSAHRERFYCRRLVDALREDGLAVVENGDRRMRWSLFSSGGFELPDAFQSFCSQFGSIACDRELTATLDLG